MGKVNSNTPLVGVRPKSGKTGIDAFDAAKSLFDGTVKKLKGVDGAKVVKTLTNPKAIVQIHMDVGKQAGLASVYGGLEAAELWSKAGEKLQILGFSKKAILFLKASELQKMILETILI
jgi:hypothetical protein